MARWPGGGVAALSLIIVGLLAGSLLAPGAGPSDSPPATSGVAAGGARSAPVRVRASVGAPASAPSVVANVEGARALVYRTPADRRPWRRLSNPTPQRTPLVFLVRARVGSWLRVLLPSRPNGAEGWIRGDRVQLRADRYSVLVGLKDRRIVVRDGGRVLIDAPVGVGRAVTPTPTGLYYVTELLRQPDPRGLYGPWAFALSAHSSVLSHFGGGDGQVGIHGTNTPSGIGHTVSHGCIRLANRVIERLAAVLPLGTPVRIVARAHPARPRLFTRT